MQLLPRSSSEKKLWRIVDKDEARQKKREGFKISGAVGIQGHLPNSGLGMCHSTTGMPLTI
jgi:hypothetical protein